MYDSCNIKVTVCLVKYIYANTVSIHKHLEIALIRKKNLKYIDKN